MPQVRIDLIYAYHALGRGADVQREINSYCADFKSDGDAQGIRSSRLWSTIPRGLAFETPWPAFEPRLFEPESLFPGSRIFCAETKATKHPRKVHEDASRDKAYAKQVG